MKLALLNLLLACLLIVQAWQYPRCAIPFGWLGGCFLILSGAYALGKPAIFGKRADGTISLWSWLLLLPLHCYMHLIWHLYRLLSPEPALCRITPRLWIGRRLLAGELPKEIELVIDLTAEFPEPKVVRTSVQYRLFPMLDASTAPHAEMQEFIATLPEVPTYIHCAQGHGRTGLFSATFLLSKGVCKSVGEAMNLLTAARPGIRLSSEQAAFLEAHYPNTTDSH